jgi:cyclase
VKEIFIPITLCGGIRSIKNIEEALRVGADKIAINTYAIENPNFIKKAVGYFGSSSVVSSIEAKQIKKDKWEIYKYNGRERTGIDLIYWINKVQDMGCGEIFVTSIDFEGTQKGFDINLISKIKDIIKVPFVISGGCSDIKDINKIKKNFKDVDVAVASALHYKKIQKIK